MIARLPILGMLLALAGCASPTPPLARPLPVAAAPADRPRAQATDLERAEALFDAYEYLQAEALLGTVLQRDPDNDRARYLHTCIGFIVHRCPPSSLEMGAEQTLRIKETQREVEATLRDAERSLNEGDRVGAMALLGPALQTLRWFPYRLEGDLEATARHIFTRLWPTPEEWGS